LIPTSCTHWGGGAASCSTAYRCGAKDGQGAALLFYNHHHRSGGRDNIHDGHFDFCLHALIAVRR
jgi:hypothetical protein